MSVGGGREPARDEAFDQFDQHVGGDADQRQRQQGCEGERRVQLRRCAEQQEAEAPLELTNSPITAPITASVMATLAPVSTKGSAAGNCTLMKICQGVARRLCASSSSSRGVARKPAVVSTMIGKNDTSQTIASLDSIPVPSQIITIGASATFGTDCSATSSG